MIDEVLVHIDPVHEGVGWSLKAAVDGSEQDIGVAGSGELSSGV